MIPPDPAASGKDVRFDPPAWALSECTLPITTPMRVRKAGTFDEVWTRGLVAIEDRLRQGMWRWPEKPTETEAPLQAKLRERLATRAEGTDFDMELEAYALSVVRHTDLSLLDLSALRPRALAYWTTRSDPATALETLVRGMCTSCFARDAYSTLRALHGEPIDQGQHGTS